MAQQLLSLPLPQHGRRLWFALHYGRYSPVGFVERPEPNFAYINLDAGASTQGSYAFLVDAQAPAWWAGWRAGLTLAPCARTDSAITAWETTRHTTG